MRKQLTIELSDERADQVAHMGKRLRLTEEQVLELALNLVIGEWKEIEPELEAYEVPSIGRH